jgi:hypothetical protein
MGTDAVFDAPYLNNSIIVTDAEAIRDIEDDVARELSAAYAYDPVFEPGTFKGMDYDFIMTNIRGNHVALVEEGRAGPDVLVADAQITTSNPMEKIKMGLKELIAKLKEFIATAEEEGAQIDPDSLNKGEELLNADEDAPDNMDINEDDEAGEAAALGAQLYALIDTIDDRELAGKIKALLDKAQAAQAPAKDAEPKPEDGPVAEDEDEVDAMLKKLEAMLRGGVATDADPEPETKAEKKAEDEDPDKKDEDNPVMANDRAFKSRLSRLAQDINTVKKTAAVDAQRHFRGLYDAARKVRPLVGEIDAMAFDSAGSIYRYALKKSGKATRVTDTTALADMVDMALDARSVAFPPAITSRREFDGPFAGLKNIKIQN